MHTRTPASPIRSQLPPNTHTHHRHPTHTHTGSHMEYRGWRWTGRGLWNSSGATPPFERPRFPFLRSAAWGWKCRAASPQSPRGTAAATLTALHRDHGLARLTRWPSTHITLAHRGPQTHKSQGIYIYQHALVHLAVQAYARYKWICVRMPVQTNCNAPLVRSCWETNADNNASPCTNRTNDTMERVGGGGWGGQRVGGCVWRLLVCLVCIRVCEGGDLFALLFDFKHLWHWFVSYMCVCLKPMEKHWNGRSPCHHKSVQFHGCGVKLQVYCTSDEL